MQHRTRRALVVGLLVVPFLLTACGGDSQQAVEEAVAIEQVGSSDLSNITLSAKAAQRLDIQTAAVVANGERTVVPYAAVIYSPNGDTWAYVNSEGLTFVRQAIVIDRIDGDEAHLSKGPSPGTKVATVGVQELYGAESGVGGGH